MILLDLDNCTAGYCPTEWQRSRFPTEYRPKLHTLFDGIDTDLWKPDPTAARVIAGRAVPPETKIVTYVSRGMESIRGFDIFLRAAKKLCDRRPDVIFAVVGSDRVCYGGDERFTGGKTFKEWVRTQDDYDAERILFTGPLPEAELAKLFAIADLHIYLTVPFVLSWSLFDALACGCTVLASDTAPVGNSSRTARPACWCRSSTWTDSRMRRTASSTIPRRTGISGRPGPRSSARGTASRFR